MSEKQGGESFRLDHAVVLVSNLDQAAEAFRALGFTVTEGGEHRGGGTRNALIAFQDGSYIELLAFTRRSILHILPLLRSVGLHRRVLRRRPALERRFLDRARGGDGLIDLALTAGSLERAVVRWRGSGLKIEGPTGGGRLRPDGERVEWEVAIPSQGDLPFLCADITEPDLRVPGGEARDHENGALGMAAVVVAVANLETSSARYRSMLGVDPITPVNPAVPWSRSREFPLPNGKVILVAPTDGTPELKRHLRARGEGPFKLMVRAEGREGFPTTTRTETLGALLEFVREEDRASR